MRLLAFDDGDGPTMGRVIDGNVTPLGPLDDFYADLTAGRRLAADPPAERRPLGTLHLLPPVPSTCRVVCVGVNYRRHADEASVSLSGVPTIFARFTSTLIGHDATVSLPPGEPRLDWEGELAAIVGAPLSGADAATAAQAVLGYTCFNDLSARGYQMATSQWTLGKNSDRSGPTGPELVTADELGDPYSLHLETRRNGEVMQSASTADMIFRVGEVLAYISGSMSLRPGDLLATGTPEGVGFTRTPPVLLGPGDVVEVEIERIGVLRTTIA
jgi:2,4-diketo-3-deoxy-L-fuconate hydrolase